MAVEYRDRDGLNPRVDPPPLLKCDGCGSTGKVTIWAGFPRGPIKFCSACEHKLRYGGQVTLLHMPDPYEEPKLPLRWDDSPQKRQKHRVVMGVIIATQVASMIGMAVEHFPGRIFAIDFIGFLIVCAAVTAATRLTRAIPMNPTAEPFMGGYRDAAVAQAAPRKRFRWHMDPWVWKLLGFGLLAPFVSPVSDVMDHHPFNLVHTTRICMLTWAILFPIVVAACLRRVKE
jgi:hypothetical protein